MSASLILMIFAKCLFSSCVLVRYLHNFVALRNRGIYLLSGPTQRVISGTRTGKPAKMEDCFVLPR